MKVLLDTNIIIHREASTICRDDIGYLFNWLDKLHYEKYIHPLTKEELKKHSDSNVVKTLGIKLENYRTLKTEAPVHSKVKEIGDKFDDSRNDENDTLLLNELYQSRVDILITEDNKIHLKAEHLNIAGKVFKIEDFLHKVTNEYPNLTEYNTLSVRKTYFGKLDINDPFFDSFKENYKGFETWFNKKSEEDVYVCKSDNNRITAFLYLKTESENENYSDIEPIFLSKKRLKIGTFKVINTGFKLGERFIKIVFDNAIKQNVDEIYLTIFDNSPEQKYLIALIEEWGFHYYGKKRSSSGEEKVYMRNFSKKFDVKNIKHTYPFISRRRRKFIVPIRPEYHTDLLPDSILTNEQDEDFVESKPHRNAIHKVYISRSFRRDMNRGDIVLFYRTGGRHKGVITTIAMVDSVIENIRDETIFVELCKARSVFSKEELLEHWNYRRTNRPFIVNFLYVQSFPKPFLNLARLIQLGIIKDINSVPRGFEEISDEKFQLIVEASNVRQSIIVD